MISDLSIYKKYKTENRAYIGFKNIIKKKVMDHSQLIISYNFIIIYFLCSFSVIICKQRKIEINSSSIYLKVKGIGNKQIIWVSFENRPNEIYINGIIQNTSQYYLGYSENNVTLSWKNILESTSQMFNSCPDIIEIDLSNFDTSNLKETFNMFVGCNSLRYINFSNFKTSKVTTMSNMFVNCDSLTSIDLSNFDTSNVENMESMFFGCSSLISLNLSSFITSKVTNMDQMFRGCSNLTSLDLSNFNATKVTKMKLMFFNCYSLRYLFLSNLNTSKAESKESIFTGCSSLEFINLKGGNLAIELIYKLTRNKENLTICDDVNNYYATYFTSPQKMICDKGPIHNEDEKEFKCTSNNSAHYNKHACEICGKNDFFQLYNDENINNSYIKCSYSYEGYYLDVNDLLYKQCYFSCKTCNKSGNDTEHNCLKCKEDYSYESYVSVYKNCYKINTFTDITSNINNDKYNSYHHLIDITSDNSEYFNYLIDETSDNSDFLTNKINDILNKSNYAHINNTINNLFDNINSNYIKRDITYNYFSPSSFEFIITDTFQEKNDRIKNESESIQNIIDNILNNLNLTDIDNGIDKTDKKDNLVFIFTSTENQKNKKEEKNITIDLGQCENKLKQEYDIHQNDSLYVLQIISEEEGMKIPKLEYELYYPLYNSNNLTKLNLTLCKGTKIEISISVPINDTLDKYDPKSDFYNDICTKATSESGTDICLKDRQNEFVDNNMSLCEENCELVNYNYTTKKAICSCEIKLELTENYDIKFNKKDFFKSFTDIKSLLNLNIMKCYKTVFKVKDLTKNNGCFIISFILLLYFITLLIFIFSSFYKLKKEIGNILYASKFSEGSNERIEVSNQMINKKIKNILKIKKKKEEIKNNFTDNNKDIELKKEDYAGKLTENNNEGGSAQRIGIMGEVKMGLEGKNIIFNKKSLELKDFEINSLDNEEMIKSGHRSFFEYYISLLKYNHPFSFSFATFSDYNSRIIKIFLFFFSFSLDFTINTLFFNDDTMHKIKEDKGKFNFLYQLPQIFYSTIISKIIDTVIKILALSQDDIVELKKEKEKKKLYNKYKSLIRKLKIKFTLFFIIAFFILIFFWFYITCFCGIYVNTQTHLIKDSVISFLTGLLYPFGLYLIPGIFRIFALRAEKQNRKCMFKISSFIESFLG